MAGVRVLSDASPLIGLARVQGLDWLRELFGTVGMPREVRAEVLSGRGLPDEAEISAALSAGWLQVLGPAPSTPPLPDLDEGEAACIRLALAQGPPMLLLMDERAGRAIAQEHGLQVTGTAAIVGLAKQRGLIASAREVFAQLHRAEFRIAPEVITRILQRVDES